MMSEGGGEAGMMINTARIMKESTRIIPTFPCVIKVKKRN